jgi:hypothetical protein
VRRRVRFGWSAALVAVLGIAAVPSVSYSARALQRHGQYGARSSKAKTKKHREGERCKNGEVRKNGECVKRMPAPEARSATIIVHTISCGGAEETQGDPEGPHSHCGPLQNAKAVRISRLGPDREYLSSVETEDDTAHVVPGRYGVEAVGTISRETEVTVSAGRTVEVTLEIKRR